VGIRREFFVSIIFLLCVNLLTAFSDEIDTLKNRLKNVTGKEKMEILNELAGAYWELPPNERIAFAEQAIDLAEEFYDHKSKADAYNHLGIAYNNMGDSKKSMEYFLKALKIMEQINDKNGIANSYVNIGQANFYLDNFDKALEYFQKALKVREEVGDKMDVSQSLILVGNIMGKTAKYNEALDYYFEALAIKKEIDDKTGISQVYNNLGNIYFETGHPKRALEYREKSLRIDRELGNKWEIANTAFNIAEYYLQIKQPEKAYPYMLESQEISEYLENKGLIRDNLYNYSLYHELKGDYQKALKYQRDYSELTKSLFSKELSEKIAEMQIKYETEKKERENQAYKLQLEKARSERVRLTLGLVIALLIVFIIYYGYRIKKRSTLLLQELVTERTHELQQKINELEQTEKALRESEEKYRLLAEQSGQMTYDYDISEGQIKWSGDILAITGYTPDEFQKVDIKAWEKHIHPDDRKKALELLDKAIDKCSHYQVEYRFKHKNGNYLSIEDNGIFLADINGKAAKMLGIMKDITERKRAEEKIKTSLREKEVMLREIHHRVKNNMQIIISLLRLQSTNTKNKKMQEAFKESQNRIHSMSLIHEKLYQSKDLARIDFAYYIRGLIVHLFQSYRVDTNLISLKTYVEDIYLDINRAIPCGLIINELVTNSIKHAFPGGKKGEISVRLHLNKQGKIALVVSDNGVGFPEDIDFLNIKSLGMQLVNDLTQQLEGTIEFDRKGGTTFNIVF